MKRIEDLLNSLLTKPQDKTGISTGSPAKGAGEQSATFGQVLAQITQGQNAVGNQGLNAPTGSSQNSPAALSGPHTNLVPGVVADSFQGSVSQVSITVTETLRNATRDQVRQAEQTLQNLMTGLLTLLQGLSASGASKGISQEQAQALNASLELTPADLQSISNLLQPFTQKLPEDQNPFSLDRDQQARLLAQMVQQMLSAQQVLFGTPGRGNGDQAQFSSIQGIGQTARVTGSTTILRLSFSDLQVNAFQNQEGQSSRISIDMESFKMSATFIQAESKGRPLVLPQGMTALNDSNISEDLTQKLQQALAAVQDQQGPMPSNQSNSFNQVLKPETLANFKELVQLLMQSGVTRAALTSFMNRNQENANQNPNNPSAPLGERGQVLAPKTPSEILLLPVEGAPNVSSTPTFEVSRNLASQLNQISSQLTEGNVAVVPASNGDLSPQTSLRSETTVQSSSASQGEVPPTTAFGPVGVLSSALEPNPEMVGPIHPSAQSVGNAPFMRPAGNVQTHQEIQDKVIQNDNVSKLNTASLHATQGSLTFGDLHPFSSQVYTLNQVTGSQAATQLNSPIPAVLSGSPSVPQNTPEVPPVEVALRTQTIKAEVTAALDLGRSTSRSANGNTPALQVGGEISRSSTQSVLPIEVLNNPTLPEPTATNTGLNETKIPAVAASDLSPNSISIPTSASQADLFKGNLQTTVPNDHGVTDTSRPGTLPHTVPAPALIPAPGPAYQGQVAQSQGMIPPVPTSTTPLVPFTATAGEGLKAELQPQMLQGTLNAGRTVPVGSFQPDQTIKVQAPEGVTPIVSVTGTDSSNQVLSATDKSDPKDTTSLDIATLLASTGSGVSRPEDSLKFAQNMNNLSNNPRFSMDQNQIYDLVSAQLTTQLVQARNVSRLNFQLVPESLGKVTVQIALVDQSLSARIFVSNPEVREAVQNHLVDLRASLSQAGLQIDQLQVQVQGGGANLLGQYYQYQQEGSSYRSPIYEAAVGQGGPENLENTGVLASSGRSLTLVDLLA